MPRPERAVPGLAALTVAAMVAAGLAPGASRAAEPETQLKDVERALEQSREHGAALEREAHELAAQAARLRQDSVAAAKKAQDLESSLSALEKETGRLAAEEAVKTRAFGGERDKLARLLAAMERIARHPPAALIAEPAAPSDAVRSAILLRAAVPAIETKARDLGAELAALAALKHEIARRRADIDAAGKALDVERGRLASLAEEKTRLESRTREEGRDEAKRAADLAAQADSLRELLARIEAARLAKPPPKPVSPKARPAPAGPAAIPAQPAPLPLPARGEIVRHFGDDDEIGGRTKGITIRTRPDAQVVAPADGEVVFAGPFRGFGQLLIIQSGAEYHALLGGLARIDAEVGRSVLAGEPVGLMRGSREGGPELYFELRRKGQPINPLPWLAAGNSKVNG